MLLFGEIKDKITKKIKLGRLETSEDFKVKEKKDPKITEIESLKINVRPIEDKRY